MQLKMKVANPILPRKKLMYGTLSKLMLKMPPFKLIAEITARTTQIKERMIKIINKAFLRRMLSFNRSISCIYILCSKVLKIDSKINSIGQQRTRL